jgi:hypothetical protein
MKKNIVSLENTLYFLFEATFRGNILVGVLGVAAA